MQPGQSHWVLVHPCLARLLGCTHWVGAAEPSMSATALTRLWDSGSTLYSLLLWLSVCLGECRCVPRLAGIHSPFHHVCPWGSALLASIFDRWCHCPPHPRGFSALSCVVWHCRRRTCWCSLCDLLCRPACHFTGWFNFLILPSRHFFPLLLWFVPSNLGLSVQFQFVGLCLQFWKFSPHFLLEVPGSPDWPWTFYCSKRCLEVVIPL